MPTNETEEPTMNAPRSLSFFVTVWMAAAIAVSMAAYAIYQYFAMPGMTVADLFLHHLWHVLVLGTVIYILCWVVFDRALLQPMKRIYLHLYAVGAGKLEPLKLDSRVTEIQTIVEGVNLMLSRLKHGADANTIELARQRIEGIRNSVMELNAPNRTSVAEVLDALAELERGLPVLAQSKKAQPDDTQAVSTESEEEGKPTK
jgi:methyl-accepting chemotaxis protein